VNTVFNTSKCVCVSKCTHTVHTVLVSTHTAVVVGRGELQPFAKWVVLPPDGHSLNQQQEGIHPQGEILQPLLTMMRRWNSH
jgi:hypothetical protein